MTASAPIPLTPVPPQITYNAGALTLGVIVATDDAATLTLTITTPETAQGSMSPGINYALFNQNYAVLVSGTSLGGETSITRSAAIAAAGSYLLNVNTASAADNVILQLDIAGASFIEASMQGAMQPYVPPTPQNSAPTGWGIALGISGIDSSTQITEAVLYSNGPTQTVAQAPDYAWLFNDDNTSNPKTDFALGTAAVNMTAQSINLYTPNSIMIIN